MACTLSLLVMGFVTISRVDASVVAQSHIATHHGGKPVGAFLSNRQTNASQLKRSMQEAVDEVLGSGSSANQQELERIRQEIEPMWASLSKNSESRVERRLVQYVVQRYFLRKHGLSIVGLEASHAASSRSEASLLTNFAPNYVRTVLEGDDARKGFFMEDAVGLIAALEHLVQHSTGSIMENAYKAMGQDTGLDLNRTEMGEVMDNFMLRWMLAEDEETIELLESSPELKDESFEDWKQLSAFVRGLMTEFEYMRSHPRGPSKPSVNTWNSLRPHFSFNDAEAVASKVAMTFGSYWATECASTREALIAMDKTGSGRVKLSDFHGSTLDGEWRFSESKDYLRQLGALDETSSWQGPRVIISNYVQSPSNCIIAMEHFRVCCANECEHHLAEIESAIRAPFAVPEDILPVVKNLSSWDTDDEPVLTPGLTQKLWEIADANSGKVPLHGRLFAQWLHYVFPLDCPFPHKSNTTTTLDPLAFGDDYMASEEEMESHKVMGTKDKILDDAGPTPSEEEMEEEWLSHWSHEEELLTEQLKAPWEADFPSSTVVLMLMGGICCLVLKFGSISSGGSKDVFDTHGRVSYV